MKRWFTFPLLVAILLFHQGDVQAAPELEPDVQIGKRTNGLIDMTITTRLPEANKDLAREKALEHAQDAIRDLYKSRVQYTPFIPSKEFIRERLLKQENFSEVSSGDSTIGNFYNAQIKLEIPPSMEQQFRKAGRVLSGLWGVAFAMVAMVLAGLFFRLDEWTKGYLTNWLLLCAAGILTGLGASILLFG